MSPSSTSTSNRETLIAVVRRVGLFFLPVLLVLGAFEIILWRSGECWPRRFIVQRIAQDSDYLYGRKYFSQDYKETKLELIRLRKAELLALGSSRVMQFRDIMMSPHEQKFFNGGGIISGIGDIEAYAHLVVGGRLPAPKLVILGIDPWWLSLKQKRKRDTNSWIDNYRGEDNSREPAAHLSAIKGMLFSREFPWRLLQIGSRIRTPGYGLKPLGLLAVEGDGFRCDGSYLYFRYINAYRNNPEYFDRETPPVIERVNKNVAQFNATRGIDPEKVAQLIDAIANLRNAGVEVCVLLPPFATPVDDAIKKNRNLTNWYAEYHNRLPQALREAGIQYLDVESPKTLGLSDDYMIDGFHASDVFVSYALEKLIEQAPVGSYLASIDRVHLRSLRNRADVIPVSLDPPSQ
jgi:hypothetical protein